MKYTLALLLALASFGAVSAPVCTFSVSAIVASGPGPYVTGKCSETIKGAYFGVYCQRISRVSGWVTKTIAKGHTVEYWIPSEIFDREGTCNVRMSVKNTAGKVVAQASSRWATLQVNK